MNIYNLLNSKIKNKFLKMSHSHNKSRFEILKKTNCTESIDRRRKSSSFYHDFTKYQ